MRTVYLRLWIPVIVLLLTTALLTGMVFYHTTVQTHHLRQKKTAYVHHLMIRLQRLTEEALKHRHIQLVEQEISALGIETEINHLALITPAGKVQYATRYAWKSQKATDAIPGINAAHLSNAVKSASPVLEFSEDGKTIRAYFPILFVANGRQLRSFSYGLLFISYDLGHGLAAIWHEVLTESGLLWLSCLFLMLFFMMILDYLVNRPVNHLLRAIQNYSDAKPTESRLTGNGELAVLGDAFNELSRNLFATRQRLDRQIDLYAILSETDQLIVRTDSSQELFDEICQIAVAKERFSLAWVGLVNQENDKVDIVAKAGKGTACLEQMPVSLDGDSGKQGITGTAIKKSRHVIDNDFSACKTDGIRACAAFPIIKFGVVIGAFNVCATSRGYFDQQMVTLLDEMGKDISFALENIMLAKLKRQAENALQEKEKKWSVTLDSIADGVIVTDEDCNVIRMNPVAETLTGWTIHEAMDRPFDEVFKIINTQSRKVMEDPIAKVLQRQKAIGLANHTTLVSKQGQEYQIADSAAPIFDEQKNILGVVLVFQDVTEQYAMIEALRVSEMRFQDVIEASGSYIWELDMDGHYTYLTEKAESIKGRQLPQLLGRRPYDFMPEDEIAAAMETIGKAIADKGRFELSHRNVTPDGLTLWEEVKGQAVVDKHGNVTGVRGVGVSINQRKQTEAEVERLAYYDPLTSLPNRRMINARLAEEIAAAKRHGRFGALLFLDLDHFKNLNDSLGHEIGDELLVQVARRLSGQLRQEDLAARLGGDEFIILLAHLSDDLDSAIGKTRKVTEKLLDRLREPYTLKEYQYYNNSSIGISLFPVDNENAATVFKQADIALYRAKDDGRNSFQFYRPEMQEKAYRRLEIEKDLRQALSGQQLQLYYQPQINHYSGLIGAETLLRWVHPVRGFVSPAEFIPVAEEAGLIIDIGNWIFKQGFTQVKTWMEDGLLKEGQHISINVSPRQFKQHSFVDDLTELVKETGVDPHAIILELTEGTFLNDIDEVVEKMLHLRALGFVFSVDDFGTGYSSLSYLKQLPIRELKIDKAFIDDLEVDNDDQIIVDTIIAMAKHLKFSAIAEGVENEFQLEFLKAHGCFNYQGYFFSKPLDQETFEDYMRQHNSGNGEQKTGNR